MKERREFLKFTLAGVSSLALPSSIFASSPEGEGYKALVVIYHPGGNDTLNMFIPSSTDEKTGYPNYRKARDVLKVKNLDLPLRINNGEVDLTQGNPYSLNNQLNQAYTKGFYRHEGLDVATNAVMPEVAHLVNQGEIAIIANCGNIVEPATKAEFQAKTKTLPPFLFAHDHQTKLTMNGEAGILDSTGWAGRLADDWSSSLNAGIYGMNISVSSNTHMFYGNTTTPLLINPNGVTSYARLKREIYDEQLNLEKTNMFQRLYNELRKHSFSMQDTLLSDWNNVDSSFSSKNAYGGELFSYPSDGQLNQSTPSYTSKTLLLQLKTVTKLSKIAKSRGISRQIFFVKDEGYDTHSNQTIHHSKNLRGVSLALGDFNKALKEMGMENEVTTFNISDFGRSLGSNGDGTDHGWGSTLFAMGGAVKGGLYGTMPDLTLGGDEDISNKGRLIPSTSMSQYYGTFLKWFGVDDATMSKILPELNNFTEKDLGFMG